MAEQSHFERFAEHILGNDDSEIGKVRAERDYALHCLEREIAICANTHAALLARVQGENKCERTGQPCREWNKCGCFLEAQAAIDAIPPQVLGPDGGGK